jgi:choline dehydrogenase
MTSSPDSYDYVVIGAGAAGSIVAGQAAAAGFNVLLLETGAPVSPDNADVWDPMRWYKVLENPAFELGFQSTPQAQLDNRVINLLQSKGPGGCQIHNAMVYVRGGRSTYDHWATALGCTGWSYDELRPFFEAVEATVGVSSPEPTAFTAAFVAAAERLGLPFNPGYNGGPTEYGSVPFQFTVDNDGGTPRRTTSYEKYVAARSLLNLTVATNCTVQRLILGQGVPAVEYLDAQGQLVTVQPNREVVLSAGAIATPAILLRSGIGPAAELQALNIDVFADLPAVGQNFYDDLGVGVFVEPAANIPGQTYGYLGIGAFATATGDAPSPTPGYGEVNIEVQISTSALPGAPIPVPTLPSYCIIGASALHLKSRGTVKIASADPSVMPVVDPGWLSDQDDWPHVFAALALVYNIACDPELAAAGGWTPLPPQPVNPYFPLFPLEVATWWIRKTGLTVQHYVGSCAMGTDPSQSVVDPQTLQVHGVPGLRVIDASVAPTPVTGNTAGVSMLIGAKGASLLLGG